MEPLELRGVEHQYAYSMADGYARYTHLNEESAKRELLDAMTQAEQYATEVRSSEDLSDPMVQNGLVAGAFIVRHAIERLPETPPPTEEGEAFIDLFDAAMEAFFSGEISFVERARLFDMAQQASLPPNGRKDRNQRIYQARANFVAAVFDKRAEGSAAYQGISIPNFLETATWLYGTSDEAAQERGWSLEPQKSVLKQNLALLRRSRGELDEDSQALAEAAGISQQAVLEYASRALHRFVYRKDQVEQDLEHMRETGILTHVKRRPDILNYPYRVIVEHEDAYVNMGIDRELVRSQPKLYVYNPATIQQRFETIVQLVEHVTTGEKSEIESTIQEVLATPRILIETSERRAQQQLAIFAQFGHPEDWADVVHYPHPNAQGAPRQAVLNNLFRAGKELMTVMQSDPAQNIFVVARQIVHRHKRSHAS